ncbi:ATP-binding cassette domain-containing protein, partial [Terribacillus saccharophilus]
LNLQIEKGEFICFIGPSGCGKTTSMKMVNRLIEPTEGRILIDGKDIMKQNRVQMRREIGYVIQQIGLFPHMTISENITLVPKLLQWSK